jgi:hypothetical protein
LRKDKERNRGFRDLFPAGRSSKNPGPQSILTATGFTLSDVLSLLLIFFVMFSVLSKTRDATQKLDEPYADRKIQTRTFILPPDSALELLERFEEHVHLFALDADACVPDADSKFFAHSFAGNADSAVLDKLDGTA